MVLLNKDKKSIRSIITVCRILLAVVMMLSGFLKAADPVGAMYKLKEYTVIMSIGGLSDAWLLAIAVAQSAFEFLLGLFLLVGIYRRVVPWLLLIAMSFFMPLSLYLWLNGSIDDCGCFGETVTVSNRTTFIKNIVLLLLAIVVFCGRRLMERRISKKSRWLFVLLSFIYIFAMQAVSIMHLPLIDTGVYATGEDLRAKVSSVPDEYEYLSIYQRGEEEIVLPADSVPGADWERVGVRPVLVKQGIAPQIKNFSIIDWEWDIEIADELIADTGYVCLVVIEKVENASMTHVDKINDLYDHCQANSISFCAATASGDDEIALWCKRTGAEYPLYWADEMLLRSMIRSNPGLLLLKDGVIVGKWNVSDIPDIEKLAASPTLMPDAVPDSHGKAEGWLFWVALLFAGLMLMVSFDFLWVYLARKKSLKNGVEEQKSVAENIVVETEKENTESSDINKNINL